MSTPDYGRTRRACYYAYLSMASVFCLPSVLFVTFHERYGISYTLLGTLLLVNFCTQLLIDLAFSLFAKHFNAHLAARVTPLITSFGLIVYAVIPLFFPDYAVVGLIVGTLIFSVAAGLNEVLISPLVAACPSENPEKDMSTLHSLYGWGVVSVVTVSTLFLWIFGTENWMYLTLLWAVLPLGASYLFFTSPMPTLQLSEPSGQEEKSRRGKGIALCFVCIFLGSASENVMTGWISGFMENALLVPKIIGDVLGMALFALLLALTRNAYARFGKNILRTMLVSMIGAVFCYLLVGLSGNVIVAFVGCVLTGVCTSMLWPGTLILMEEKITAPGVAAYALMAAGGDLGAALAPQLLGFLVDETAASEFAVRVGTAYAMTVEQVGLKVGMLVSVIFPILGTVVLLIMRRYFSRHSAGEEIAAK